MSDIEREQEKAREYDEKEREEQRQTCRNYIFGLHKHYFSYGIKRGVQRVEEAKGKIRTSCTKAGEYVWTAGQFLNAQVDVEVSHKMCRFRFETELFADYVKAVESRREELEQYDAELYEESLKIAERIKRIYKIE